MNDDKITDASLLVLHSLDLVHALSQAEGKDGSRPMAAEEVVSLELEQTDVTDAGLKELSGLINLEKLDLNQVKVTNAGIKELAPFKKLRELNLWGTKVTDAGLKGLSNHKKLTLLQLDREKVTDVTLRTFREFGLLHALAHAKGKDRERPKSADEVIAWTWVIRG